MAQNGVIFHLLQTLVPLFIEENQPLGKCRPVFLTLPIWLCQCLSDWLSPSLFRSTHKKPTDVCALSLKAVFQLFTLTLSYLHSAPITPLLLLLLFWPAARSAFFFRQKCTSGLWLRIRQGFWCRCGSCIVFKSTGSRHWHSSWVLDCWLIPEKAGMDPSGLWPSTPVSYVPGGRCG